MISLVRRVREVPAWHPDQRVERETSERDSVGPLKEERKIKTKQTLHVPESCR